MRAIANVVSLIIMFTLAAIPRALETWLSDTRTRGEAKAENPRTSVRRLIALSKSHDPNVALRVAANRKTPVSALRDLSVHGTGLVRGEVALNPNTPVVNLSVLAEDYDPHVREGVAKNPRTPIEVIGPLLADEDDEVRAAGRARAQVWVQAHLQVNQSNTLAVEEILRHKGWWAFTPRSDAVLLAKALHPEPLTIGASS